MTIKDNDGGELSSVPNEKYRKFFDKFSEIETLEVSQWKVVHILGYFCKRYKEVMGSDYHWKFNNPSPTKCFEVWQANTLAAKLSQNPKILKDYIDWAFDNLVKGKNYKPRSISFITKDEIVIDYKLNVLLAGQKNLSVDRSTSLPTIYQDAIKETAGYTIKTYGELAFFSQMELPDGLVSKAMNRLTAAGFDAEVLKRIV